MNQNLEKGENPESQEQRVLAHIAKCVPDTLYLFDLIESRFVFINHRIEQVLGYRPEVLLRISGTALKTLVHPDDWPVLLELRKQLDTPPPNELIDSEFRVRHSNGKYRRLRFRSSVFAHASGGSCRRIIGTARDVTGEKQTETALRESEERLSLLVESAKDYVIITMDSNGRINMWNPGAERAFGYTEKEILGQSSELIFTPEDRAQGVPAREMKIARERGVASDKRWHIRKDGTRFFAGGVLTLLRNSEIEGFAKIAHDLTEDKEAEERLKQANDWLESRITERTAELKKTNETLTSEIAERRAAGERVRRLLREIVQIQEGERRRIARDLHDQMGQQINVLAINLDLIKKECEELNVPCERIEATQAIVEQLDSDVDFLAWELRPTVLDDLGLLAALEKYVREWSKHFGVRAEAFSTGVERDRLPMEVETMLYRIAQEALNNVAKHAGAKQVNLLVEHRRDEIWLTIEDDGKGFDTEQLALPGKDDKGLGLLGIQERAALVGGSVEFESRPGEGTTVFVRVPVLIEKGGKATK
jgi:PAS domain S-box-containing protein